MSNGFFLVGMTSGHQVLGVVYPTTVLSISAADVACFTWLAVNGRQSVWEALKKAYFCSDSNGGDSF